MTKMPPGKDTWRHQTTKIPGPLWVRSSDVSALKCRNTVTLRWRTGVSALPSPHVWCFGISMPKPCAVADRSVRPTITQHPQPNTHSAIRIPKSAIERPSASLPSALRPPLIKAFHSQLSTKNYWFVCRIKKETVRKSGIRATGAVTSSTGSSDPSFRVLWLVLLAKAIPLAFANPSAIGRRVFFPC